MTKIKGMEKFGISINSITDIIGEKIKFRVNLIKIKRIKEPMTIMEKTLKFRDPINLIKDFNEEKNKNLESIIPKL
jgi:hypothetical protein